MRKQNISAQNKTKVLEIAPLDLAHRIIDAGLDAKATDISILDIAAVFDITDYFVILSGRSDRQVQGICNKILQALEHSGIKPQFVEGYEQGHWVVIDLSDIVVHIFYEPIREQYDLDGLWIKAKKLQHGNTNEFAAIQHSKALPKSNVAA